MFSWSTGRQRGGNNSNSSSNNGDGSTTSDGGGAMYPGNRFSSATASAATGVATAIRGTIRPPEFSRKQHIDSYVENDMLRRSTRRVSTGTFSCCFGFWVSFAVFFFICLIVIRSLCLPLLPCLRVHYLLCLSYFISLYLFLSIKTTPRTIQCFKPCHAIL